MNVNTQSSLFNVKCEFEYSILYMKASEFWTDEHTHAHSHTQTAVAHYPIQMNYSISGNRQWPFLSRAKFVYAVSIKCALFMHQQNVFYIMFCGLRVWMNATLTVSIIYMFCAFMDSQNKLWLFENDHPHSSVFCWKNNIFGRKNNC